MLAITLRNKTLWFGTCLILLIEILIQIYAELLEMHRDFPVGPGRGAKEEAALRLHWGVGRPCTPPTVNEADGVPRPRGRERWDRSPGR